MKLIAQEDNKEKIMSSFRRLLAEHEAIASKVATKEEEAEKAKHRELLETAATYTVDHIVNGTAALQLDFGGVITNLAERLLNESKKLDALKKAIAIERNNLDRLQKIRIVADCLYILRKEHDEKLMIMATNINQQKDRIEKEMTQVHKTWAKEQTEYEARISEQEALKVKEKEREIDNYSYEIERKRRIEMDKYKDEKRIQERYLLSQQEIKAKDWTERETYLTEKQAEFDQNRKKIAGHDEELKKIYEAQKGKAVEKAKRDAKVKTNLIEKEWTAEKKGYELRITALETTIDRQIAQISELTAQLQSAGSQAQNLAIRAFKGSDG